MQFASEIAPWIDMSYPNWLIFFRNETKIQNFFSDIYVPFDCTFMVSTSEFEDQETILEVYQIERDKELRQGLFGTWDIENGIKLSTSSLYQRRNDLFGQTLRVVSVHDPPSSIVMTDDKEIVNVGGFFGGIMELLKESMNCTITYQVADEFGNLLDNGSWTGAINQLVDKTSDIAAAELMMTADRLESVKFTTPLYSTKTRTFIKKPSSSTLKWDAYISPFSFGIWSTMGIMIVLTSISISVIKSLTLILCSKIEENKEPSKILDISFAVFGAFCSQGMEMSMTDSVRIIHLVIHVTAVIILAAYSAALISALAVKTFIMPFTTMKGLLDDATYRFGVIGASADYSFFQNSSDKIISDLSDNFLAKEVDLPINYLDGLMRVCSEDKYAFMALDNAVAQLKSSVDCVVVPLDTISQTSIAMALRKDSPFRGLINSKLFTVFCYYATVVCCRSY
uniref:Ionotropic receptor 6 n=1 Tax=Aulacocentrum confusum TaxID=2767324 RepID=A0A7G8Z9H8_9HYME|nr:ionotropic receptor 6 [Aulacocentrum confusum]